MELSGLASKWNRFKTIAETVNTRTAIADLKARISKRKYKLFLRRLGIKDPHVTSGRKNTGNIIWTKGGCWHKKDSFTQIILLGQTIDRPFERLWQLKLGKEGCRQIEKELASLIDPDKHFVHECKEMAVRYVMRRIPEYIGWSPRRLGIKAAAWFFQKSLPVADTGRYIKLIAGQPKATGRSRRDLKWFTW